MPDAVTTRTVLERAMTAIAKIDGQGPRGIERVTHEEIEAMAILLVCFGLPARDLGPNGKDPVQ